MNWPALVRSLVDSHNYRPWEIERLTYDQLWVLTVDSARLLRRRIVTGTIEELRGMGIEIDTTGSMTLQESVEAKRRGVMESRAERIDKLRKMTE
jgi:hypothetical protein